MAARTLKLVANCLIKLANLAEAKVHKKVATTAQFLTSCDPPPITTTSDLENLHALPCMFFGGNLASGQNTLVSLLLQEQCMEVVNPFIRDNQQRMIMYLDKLSVSKTFFCSSRHFPFGCEENFEHPYVFSMFAAIVCDVWYCWKKKKAGSVHNVLWYLHSAGCTWGAHDTWVPCHRHCPQPGHHTSDLHVTPTWTARI